MGPGAGAGPPSKPMPAAGGDDSSDDEPLGARLKKGPPPKAAKPAAKAAPKAGKQDAAEGAPAARGAGKAEKAGKAPKRVKKEDGEPVVKRERKVYDMPGQTKATPDELDPLRKFYTSTLEQLPGSEMAKRWLLQHGLLPREEAEELFASIKGIKSPGKSPAKQHRPAPKKEAGGGAAGAKPAVKRPAKRRADDSGNDDDDDDDEEFSAKAKKSAKAPKPAAKAASKTGTGYTVDSQAVAAKSRPPGGPLPVKPAAKKTKRDVAFADGGLGSSDDSF